MVNSVDSDQLASDEADLDSYSFQKRSKGA